MYEELLELVSDTQLIADQVRGLVGECQDYELLRLLKKLDAELMDVRHNLQLAVQLSRRGEQDV